MKRSTKQLLEKVAIGIGAIGATVFGLKKIEQKRAADKATKATPPPVAPATAGTTETPPSAPAPVEEKKEG